MRPQYNRRAMRATAALCAAPLAAGAYGAAASASTARHGAHRAVVAAPLAHAAHAAARGRTPRRRRQRKALRLAARMLHRDLLVGHDVAFVGALAPAAGRDRVDVQARVGWHWIDVATTRTTSHGHFIARYWPHTLGTLRMRLRVANRGRTATVAEPAAMVFHEALVSWYGPGGVTACGEELGAGTLGVANLTLPCGTRVTLRYGGRTLTVPVIDRGPYVAGREFDLTYATKQALGAGDLTVVWASS